MIKQYKNKISKPQINWKKVWLTFDNWAYSKGRYEPDTLSATGKRIISSAVEKILKA